MNEKGWSHSFEYEVSTNDVNKGWQPIVWGIQYRVERKDNTAYTGGIPSADPPIEYLLMEDGNYLLLEDGSRILLE